MQVDAHTADQVKRCTETTMSRNHLIAASSDERAAHRTNAMTSHKCRFVITDCDYHALEHGIRKSTSQTLQLVAAKTHVDTFDQCLLDLHVLASEMAKALPNQNIRWCCQAQMVMAMVMAMSWSWSWSLIIVVVIVIVLDRHRSSSASSLPLSSPTI